MTNGIRHKTVTPSPLSQSTSAVHLHAIDPTQIQLPRRLSKRRKPFNGLFGGGNEEGKRISFGLPLTISNRAHFQVQLPMRRCCVASL